MLLYKNDIYEQGAYIHTTTTNSSFKHMHFVLKKMGVQNNLFFLGLYHKELKTINVKTLTDPSIELASLIAAECAMNPWYYFREVITIPGQGDPIPFVLNRANLMLAWCFYNNIDVFLTMPRQCGKTMSTVAILSHLIYFMCKNFSVTLLTKEHTNRLDNLSAMKKIRDGIPKYLLGLNKATDKDNEIMLTYSARNTTYKAKVGRMDYAGAENLGRGDTTPVNNLDECPYVPNFRITYPVLMGSTLKAAEQAKQKGLPYTNILTTTAGRLDSEDGKFVKNIVDSCLVFKEVLYDCKNRDELWTLVKKNSSNNMIYGVFSYLQIGKTHKWFKEEVLTKVNASSDPTIIDRDYLNIWTSGTENAILSADLLKQIKASEMDSVYDEILDGYIFRWYIHPDILFKNSYKSRNIIIGLDTSENIGKDFTSVVMIDSTDMGVVCTARCNDADLVKLALNLAQFMISHPRSILVPERRSTASMLIQIICMELRKKGINPFTRIYNEVFQNREQRNFASIDTFDPTILDGIAKKYLGFTTAGAGNNARDVLYKSTLLRTARTNFTRIRDISLISELSSLTMKNGRIDHTSSGHDDTVIAYLLACYFVYFGKNLHLYDCDNNAFLCDVTDKGTNIDPMHKESQQQLHNQIQDIERSLDNTFNPRMRKLLEIELNKLKEKIDPEVFDSTPISVEQLNTKNIPETNIVKNKNYLEAMFKANFGMSY